MNIVIRVVQPGQIGVFPTRLAAAKRDRIGRAVITGFDQGIDNPQTRIMVEPAVLLADRDEWGSLRRFGMTLTSPLVGRDQPVEKHKPICGHVIEVDLTSAAGEEFFGLSLIYFNAGLVSAEEDEAKRIL